MTAVSSFELSGGGLEIAVDGSRRISAGSGDLFTGIPEARGLQTSQLAVCQLHLLGRKPIHDGPCHDRVKRFSNIPEESDFIVLKS